MDEIMRDENFEPTTGIPNERMFGIVLCKGQ